MFQVLTALTVKVKNALHNKTDIEIPLNIQMMYILSNSFVRSIASQYAKVHKRDSKWFDSFYVPKRVCKSLVSSGRHMSKRHHYVCCVHSATSMIGQTFVALANASKSQTYIHMLVVMFASHWCKNVRNEKRCQ